MPWSVAAAGVSAGGGLLSGILGSNATSKASENAVNAEKQMYMQTRSDLMPYTEAGYSATTQQQNLLGLNGQDAADAAMSTYQTSPGYQWQMSEGLRAVDAGAAAKGMLRSGATLKAEQTYGQGLADSDFSAYYDRLSGLSKTGEAAAAQTAEAGSNTADSLSNIYTGEAGAQSSIYSNTSKGVSSAVNNLFSDKDFKSWLTSGNSSVSDNSIYNNAAYQNAAFASQPAGTYGPWQ
jgi:hypothetical protein